ncbi:VWA domain-containing protein [Corynebacterium ulceribovis]|uniref:VWA domain-containing protein n=1 Tax=Corynebacterium ulceribovis TaxID=487732 RepID=UPI00037A6AB7|nr:VWA domain-containing protein [Corynebacterium ulceribovis]
MDFAYPNWLFLLVIPIAGLIGYLIVDRSSQQRAVVFSNFKVAGKAARNLPRWTRHIAPIAAIVALTLMSVALAGPQVEKNVARNRATVILVVDVSYSMEATDVEPSRIDAAQKAGAEFAEGLPEGINLGLVSFSGNAKNLVAPTQDHQSVSRALANVKLGPATATGDALFTALDSIEQFGNSLAGVEGAPPAQIVLLSDGKQTLPPSLDDPRGAYTAADSAKEVGVPINTISFGTQTGFVDIDGERIPVPVDDESLAEIAKRSDGAAFTADSLAKLRDVYSELDDQIGYERKKMENPRPWMMGSAAALFVAVAGLLARSQVVTGAIGGRRMIPTK